MRSLRIFAIALAGALLVDPPEGHGCGPFLPEAQFGYMYNPGPEFFRGDLGIVRPQYYRRNLVVAWRYLSGVPVEPAALMAVVPSGVPWNAAQPWLKARNAVRGMQPVHQIDIYGRLTGNGKYESYPNCLPAAFDTAAATLADRLSRWGDGSANLTEWLHGQDQVFANCSGTTPVIPPPAPAGADPLLAADRQYQAAAAAFYAGKYQNAEAAFRLVAANKASPWRDSAPYLIGRTLIREGTVGGNRDAFAAAEISLREIVSDPRQQRWHDSARGLLGFVSARLHPEARLVELGEVLSKSSGANFGRALTDYTAIWDRLEANNQPLPAGDSEITDWIHTFQSGDGRHALDRWRAAGTAAWLLAALVPAQAADPAAAELIAAARKLPLSSPAYATAVYHAIRLEMALHRSDEARRWADEALAANLPLDAHNAIMDERMRLARDWTDLLRYSLRRPVAAMAVSADEDISNYRDMASPEPTFGPETAALLNERVPLDLWVDASSNKLLTPRVRAAVSQAGWVRAVILDRPGGARELARRTAAAQPALAEGLRAWESEKSPEAAKFAAVLLMLRAPGLEPLIRPGFGRFDKVEQRDDFRDNWWLLTNPGVLPLRRSSQTSALAADFLPADRRQRGEKEWNVLVARANAGPDFLAAETLKWARAHPEDPRVPEALHLVVRATHFGPRDAATGAYSKRAFQLLHSRYPSSKWAQATKYWY